MKKSKVVHPTIGKGVEIEVAPPKDTLPEVIRGAEQLSDKEIREGLRPYAPSTIAKLASLANSKNDSVSLGATKYILGKFVPDLKSEEIKHSGADLITLLDRLFNRFDANPTDSKKSVQQ